MVAADQRGRGVGTALCRVALENAVAASNRTAVALYERLGFEIVGTVPGAFEHPELGRVGLHVMYRAL
jgi:ribosomal protein S18 acetylase RimI-like enzyme